VHHLHDLLTQEEVLEEDPEEIQGVSDMNDE
jgi:hypothetical protein